MEIGAATWNADGSLNYDPKASNTMVVIIGDNGSYATTVKAPFRPALSKVGFREERAFKPGKCMSVHPSRRKDGSIFVGR